MTFQEIYVQYSKLVYNLALSYVQNIEDAEEITQDVFLTVHRGLDLFEGKAKHSTWIYRITINKSIDFIKAKNSQKRFAFFTSLFGSDQQEISHSRHNFDHPGILLEQKVALQKIFKHINELPSQQKTALILSKLEGRSQKEIAEIMELSTKAVESLVQRAKKNLSKKMNLNEGNQ